MIGGRARRILGRDLRATAVEIARQHGPSCPSGASQVVTDDDIAELPEPARRYLRFMGVVGRRRDHCFLARFTGRFRRRPDESWMRCEAWQCNTVSPVTRSFVMRIDFARLIPMVGRDTYAGGHGRMHGRLFDLVTVADGTGPEFDLGELTTWVNDALMLAPSMLLVPFANWTAVDDDSFSVTLRDAGLTTTTRAFVDANGAITDTETFDRFCALPDGLVRARWTTPMTGWGAVAGRPLPTGGKAIWHLDDGPFCYAEGAFTPGSIEYELP